MGKVGKGCWAPVGNRLGPPAHTSGPKQSQVEVLLLPLVLGAGGCRVRPHLGVAAAGLGGTLGLGGRLAQLAGVSGHWD